MLDYLVVGLGLAGVSFCETLERSGKTFTVINDSSQQASKVAGGMFNPVILKRFTGVWNAEEQLAEMLPFYSALEKKLGLGLIETFGVMRRFASVEEQNDWFSAADKSALQPYLSTKIHPNKNPAIKAPFGFGEVLGTGKIDCAKLLTSYNNHLEKNNTIISETFDYDELQVVSDSITYKGLRAKQIVFAEGYGMHRNPYFNYLPLTGTKGEYLIIKAPQLNESNAIKASIFVIPEGNDRYRIGATYKWKDKTNQPTDGAKTELIDKLDALVSCDYKVVNQLAGIRPTVTDRRPLVGKHPKYTNIYVLNGFGSRGVMIGPWASRRLLHFIEEGKPLTPEMDISRFTAKYYSK
ncbi:FAD-binding oxidoreductase [Aggregatimonas sangjinii]|uniref:FAD-binding oxidoreductase n=1 Tax=Aggregatimonas sangjinii TaxID=2583587 RepID=A0A5B7SP27_9FLAO|nr:FAD-binding oxidoreductase [Aggregatimonas sangjinii]QCW98767.1 FAD-binding oxidoreductase [Aggregatimonas sangjinii]